MSGSKDAVLGLPAQRQVPAGETDVNIDRPRVLNGARGQAARIGVAEIRTSAFFHSFSWDAFHARKMAPPMVPTPNPQLPTPR